MTIASVGYKNYHLYLENFECLKIIRIFDRMYTQKSRYDKL